MKKQLILLISTLFLSCSEQPKIPISNTLEIALGNRYSAYVSTLNKAFEKDTTALLKFIKIDDIQDAAGYDHGFILFQLLKRYGDSDFSHTLQKATAKDIKNIGPYFEVGIDASDDYRNELRKEYPISSNILQIK